MTQVKADGDLPFARGERFATLDDYLAYLERRGAMDVPWYREVEPGLFELVSRGSNRKPPVRYTRSELMTRFGFADDGAA